MIEVVTKMHKWTLVLLYVSIKQRSLEILRYPYFFRDLTVLVLGRHAFPVYNMAAFPTYNKYRTELKMNWDLSTLHIHHDSNHLTFYEHKNENFQKEM